MYLYLSSQTVHIPLEAAGEDARCSGIRDYWRRVYCSMLVELDDAVGDLVAMLEAKVGDEWVILSMGDNGGMVRFATTGNSTHDAPFWPASAGDNRPLRGSKSTLFQGGVQSTSFVSGGSSMIPVSVRGTQYDGLMHACDLAATVLGLGGVDVKLLQSSAAVAPMDGIDHWEAIMSGKGESLRSHVPINIVHNGTSYTAVRYGDFKLIVGAPTMGEAGGWYTKGLYPAVEDPPPHRNGTNYLFNLARDPYEHVELSLEQYADVVKHGLEIIQGYVTGGLYQEPQPNKLHWKALPGLHGGAWAPWLD